MEDHIRTFNSPSFFIYQPISTSLRTCLTRGHGALLIMIYSLLSLSVFLFWSSALPLLAQVYSFQRALPLQASRSFIPQDSFPAQKQPLYRISPDDTTGIWKKDMQKSPFVLFKGTPSPALPGGKTLYRWLPEAEKNAREAAAIDPGILYNPSERQQPAGIVIRPLRDIDPRMTIDPGPARQADPLKAPAPQRKPD